MLSPCHTFLCCKSQVSIALFNDSHATILALGVMALSKPWSTTINWFWFAEVDVQTKSLNVAQ